MILGYLGLEGRKYQIGRRGRCYWTHLPKDKDDIGLLRLRGEKVSGRTQRQMLLDSLAKRYDEMKQIK